MYKTVKEDTALYKAFVHSGIEEMLFETKYDLHTHQQEQSKHVFYLLLNEAITERIADEVLLEYLHRGSPSVSNNNTGQRSASAVSLEVAQQHIESIMQRQDTTYTIARRFLVSLTAAIAQEVGVPEPVVWRGFVRHYFTGETLANKELGNLLDETIGAEFSKYLFAAETGSELRALNTMYPKLAKQYPGVVERWMGALEIARGAK